MTTGNFDTFVSSTQTKLNKSINIKKLFINIMKFSNKMRKKRYTEKKFKTKKNVLRSELKNFDI